MLAFRRSRPGRVARPRPHRLARLRGEDRRGRAQERRPPHGGGPRARARVPEFEDRRPGDGGDRVGQGCERRRGGPFRRGRSAREPLHGFPRPGADRGPDAHRLGGPHGHGGALDRRPDAPPEHELLEEAGRVAGPGGELHERERALQARLRGHARHRATGLRDHRVVERHAHLGARRRRHAAQHPVLELRPTVREPMGGPRPGSGGAEPRAGLRPARRRGGGGRAIPRAEPEGQVSRRASGSA